MKDSEETNSNAELVVLQAAKGTSVVKFSDDINFAVGTNDSFIKISDYERSLIADFDGKSTLADIIAKRLDRGDTAVFNTLLTLIGRLNDKGLLAPECSEKLQQINTGSRKLFEKELAKKKIGRNGFLALLGRFFNSIAALLLFFAASLTCIFAPSLKGVNLLTSITSGTLTNRGEAYLAAIIFIVIFLFVVLSLPAFISTCVLLSQGIEPTLRLKFKYCLVYLSTDSAQIIKKGRSTAAKHYAMLLLTPFAVSGIAALFWNLGISRPMMAVINIIAFGSGLIMASPLGETPLATLLGFFMLGDGASLAYLRKKFIKDIFSTSKGSDMLIILSSVGLIWIYVMYVYFWRVARATVSYLTSDLYESVLSSETGSIVLILLSLLFILLPLIAAIIRFIIVIFGNIGAVALTPLAKMKNLAGEISSKSVPATETIVSFLKEVPLFASLDDATIKALCSHIKLRKYAKNSAIVRQGEEGAHFYTIVDGTADVIVETGGKTKTVGRLSTGDSFGETALLEKGKRTASVVATTPSTLFEISRQAFDEFVVSHAESKEKITEVTRLSKILLSSPVFSFMDQRQLSTLLKMLKTENVSAGTLIFSQGDEGNKFYLIREGRVHLTRVENSADTLDITLEEGQFFGEMALVKNIPRTASAKAVTDCVFCTLTKEQFLSMLSGSLFSGREMGLLINQRASQLGTEVLKSCSRK
ncbi:cyclic nucleotide-binding domain-containing protein [bacterium]|nr:cyclic nucleotide-binding domain-containing protein [bacterium]